MKKKVKQKKSANEENFPSIFAGKKKKIFGILIILFSIFILLSIISYSRFDKANLSYSFSDFYINHKGENILNWLGILGAYVSDFFINSTLGIFSIIFPVLFLAWGGAIFVKISFRKLINTSNFIIISAILLSSFFGILRIHFQIFRMYMNFPVR